MGGLENLSLVFVAAVHLDAFFVFVERPALSCRLVVLWWVLLEHSIMVCYSSISCSPCSRSLQ